jgi:hypothetical protein
MVGGSKGKGNSGKPVGLKAVVDKKDKIQITALAANKKKGNGKIQQGKGNGHLKTAEKQPEQLIPFDDGEFTDF